MIEYLFFNWKNYLTIAQSHDMARWLVDNFDVKSECAILPGIAMAYSVKNILSGSNIKLGLQTLDDDEGKSFTGAIGIGLAHELGASYCLVGHSEQRLYGSMDDRRVNVLMSFLIGSGICPILCVGESVEFYEKGESFEFVKNQIFNALAGSLPLRGDLIIAYEPVWAIRGFGAGVSAGVEHVENIISKIHAIDGLQNTPVIYGGGVDALLDPVFFQSDQISGFLVGSASTRPQSLIDLLKIIKQ